MVFVVEFGMEFDFNLNCIFAFIFDFVFVIAVVVEIVFDTVVVAVDDDYIEHWYWVFDFANLIIVFECDRLGELVHWIYLV